MDQQSVKSLGSDLCILIIILLYSFLLGVSPLSLVMQLLFAIPVIIYVYKKDVNNIILGIAIINVIIHTMLFGYFSSFIVFMLYLLPSIIIGRLLRTNRALSITIIFGTLVCFFSAIFVIFMYGQMFHVDLVAQYYEAIDQFTAEYFSLIDSVIDDTMALEKQVLKTYINHSVDIIKYYYIAIMFNFILISVFIQTTLSRLILNFLGWKKFKIKRLITYNLPRSFIVFFAVLYVFKEVTSNLQFITTLDNLISICIFVLFSAGVLFEIFLILNTKRRGIKLLLVVISIISIFIFPTYFVGIGLVETLLKLRDKMGKV
jgi:hypothetical protein